MPFVTGVRLGDVLERRGDNCRRLVVRHADPLVAAAVRSSSASGLPSLAPRKTVVVPLLESGADHALVDAAVAVESACQGQTLLANARVPAVRRAVAAQVHRLAVIHRRADARDDARARTYAFSRQLCVSFGAQVNVYFESYFQRSR